MITSYRTYNSTLRLLTVFLLIIFTISCKKEEQTPNLNIQGRILDSSNSNGVSNATVRLSQQVLSDGTFSSIFQPVGTVSSSSNGSYSFEFPRDAASEFKIEVEKDNYFFKEVSINPDNVPVGSAYTANIGIAPMAWVRYTIQNVNPISSADEASFQYINANFECQCCNNDLHSFEGMSVNESEKCLLEGNFYLKYRYTIDKDTIDLTVIDSVYCTAFDTTYISIEY